MGAGWSKLVSFLPVSTIRAFVAYLYRNVSQQFEKDFIGGGLTLAVAGLLTNGCWKLLWWLREEISSRLFTTVEVPVNSASYAPLMRWLQSQPAAWDSSKLYVMRSRRAAIIPTGPAVHDDGDDEGFEDRFTFVPAENSSVRMWFKGRLLWVSGQAGTNGEKSSMMSNFASSLGMVQPLRGGTQNRTRAPRGRNQRVSPTSMGLAHSYHITVFGRNKSVITALLREGQRLRKLEANLTTEVHAVQPAPRRGASSGKDSLRWYKVGERPCRSIDSVILEGDNAQHILADCREFMTSEKWFAERGIPYRRGYLLEGKPGTGKTSLITALAGDLRLPVYMLSLSSPGITDDSLLTLFNSSDPRALLLLEDIDAAFAGGEGISQRTMAHATAGRRRRRRRADEADGDSGEEDDGPGPSSLTFSGLLNAIDGVVAQQGRLLFMTTNHMERLDPALIRSGRVDYILHFDLATRQQARQLFVRFYETETQTDAVVHSEPDEAEASDDPIRDAEVDDMSPRRVAYLQELKELAEQFAASITPRTKSMADIQGYLMRHRKKPREALRRVGELTRGRAPTSGSGGDGTNGGALPTGGAALFGARPAPALVRSRSAPDSSPSTARRPGDGCGHADLGKAGAAGDTATNQGASAGVAAGARLRQSKGSQPRGGRGGGRATAPASAPSAPSGKGATHTRARGQRAPKKAGFKPTSVERRKASPVSGNDTDGTAEMDAIWQAISSSPTSDRPSQENAAPVATKVVSGVPRAESAPSKPSPPSSAGGSSLNSWVDVDEDRRGASAAAVATPAAKEATKKA